MSASSRNRKNAVLRTYSRRVNTTLETSSCKKRRVLGIDDIDELPVGMNSVHSSKKLKTVGVQRSPESRSTQGHFDDSALDKAATTTPDFHHMSPERNHSQGNPMSSIPKRPPKQIFLNKSFGAEGSSNPSMPPQLGPARPKQPQQTTSLKSLSDEASCTSEDSDHSHKVNTTSSSKSKESSAEKLTHLTSSSATKDFNPSNVKIIKLESKKGTVKNTGNSAFSATITPPRNDGHSSGDIVNTATKKRRVVDMLSPVAGSAPSSKKTKLSGIQSYFKPVSRSSSPAVASSTIQSSDSIGPPEDITPPSSPPQTEDAIFVHEKASQRRQPRRLTTRPTLEPLDNMSYHSARSYFDDDDRPSFSEIIGGVNDPARVRLAEAHLDDEEKDDLVRSQMVSPGNRPRSDSYGLRLTGNTSGNLNSRPIPKPLLPRGSESLRRSTSNPGPYRGGNRSIMGGNRSDRATPGSFSSSRIGSYPEAGPPSFPSAPPMHRSVTTGNYSLYDHDESAEYGPNRALYDKQNGRELAPYKPSHTMAIPAAPRKRNDSSGYQQLQLDLGLTQTVTCVKCKMVYSPSLPMDKRSHDDFCRTSAMPELQQRLFTNERPIYEKIVHGEQHQIRVYGRTSTQAQRAHGRKVLDTTYQDLPGLQYTDDELASEVQDPIQPNSPNMVPRFKFYVYYIGRKVIGALLVERYHQFQSNQIVERGRGAPLQGKHIIFDRLWVSPSHRRLGYASKIADNARVTFIPGVVLPKQVVAMPEQTLMGRGFAGSYFR